MFMDFRPQPKPCKRDRPGEKARRLRKRKDREWQEAVPEEGNCFNCKKWRPLCGDHAIKRRFGATRHDPANRRQSCKECNTDLETLSAKKLLKKFPDSPLRAEWHERA